MAGITENPNLHLLNLLREHGKRLVAIEQQQNMVFTDPTDTVGDPANNYAFLVIGYLGNIVGASLTGYGAAVYVAGAWEAVAGFGQIPTELSLGGVASGPSNYTTGGITVTFSPAFPTACDGLVATSNYVGTACNIIGTPGTGSGVIKVFTTSTGAEVANGSTWGFNWVATGH